MSDKDLDTDGQSLNIDQLIADFKTRTDAGEPFPFEKFIAAHPEHTDELTRYFKQWKELEAPPHPDKAGADKASTGTSEPGKISLEDATAHTVVQVSGDSQSSLTQAYDQSGTGSATSVEVSESFGRYAIQKVLGQGAMGAVYLAKDTQLDRDVALKIPKFGDGNGVDEEELLARFYREARAAATLRSPNICPVYDVGEIDGQHYITMAFIEGRPLKDYTKSKKTHSEKQIITTIRKLALGLAEAHEIGVIHRDLKPANIMVDLKGEPVVMDFGLARRSSSDDVQVTQSGAIIGTPAYMAPEQVAGDQSAIDHQADIYALGIIMYELITGEMPFKGNLMALLQQIALNNPTKPSELRPDIDPRLESICLKMIAGDQTQRYQSMTDVATDLQDVLRNPDEKHKQEQAKKKGPKPKSLPTAKEESNPALISIDRSKSSADRMRAKQGKKSSPASKSTAASNSKPSGSTKPWMIAGGIGGLVLLLGMAFFVRADKYDVQVTRDDPEITLSVDGEVLNIKEDHDVIKLSAGEHKLQLEKAGLPTHTEEFSVAKDGTNTLTAAVVNGKLDGLFNGEKLQTELSPATVKTPSRGVNSPTAREEFALEFDGKSKNVVIIPQTNWNERDELTYEVFVQDSDVNNHESGMKYVLNHHYTCAFLRWVDGWGFMANLEGEKMVRVSSSKQLPAPGDWVHLAGVIKNRTVQLFVNGEPMEAKQLPEKVNSKSGNTIQLGPNFSGKIRGVKISKTARFDKRFDPPQQFSNDADTLALYQFNEGFGDVLKDSSGNGYDGKIEGAKWVPLDQTVAIENPERNDALDFNGRTSRVEVPDFQLSGSPPLTLEGWLTPSEKSTSNAILFYGGKLDSLTIQVGGIRRWEFGGRQASTDRRVEVFGPRIKNWETRTHVAGQWDGKSLQLFIDGKPVKRNDNTGSFTPQGILEIGGHDGSRFKGKIDEIRISNTLRYNTEFTPPDVFTNDQHTLALYHFNEGSGDILKDSSGNGHDGKIVDAKWVKVDAETIAASPPPPAIAPLDAAQAKAHQEAWADYLDLPVEREVELPGGEKMAFVLIPPGEFMMGTGEEEKTRFLEEAITSEDKFSIQRIPIEGPQHRVRITRPFYLGAYEVTQSQWEAVVGTNPSKNAGNPTHPVEMVNWDDTQLFFAKLNKDSTDQSLKFALPTEAQWEYACRAGTATLWYCGDNDEDLSQFAWYLQNARTTTHPAGQLKPNAFGLYDMHGNVFEWCSDWFQKDSIAYYENSPVDDPIGPASGTHRINRGGAFLFSASRQRSAHRNFEGQNRGFSIIGFRAAMMIDIANLVKADNDSSQTIDLLADLVPTTLNSRNMTWQMQDGILAGSSSASRQKKDWVGAKFPQEIGGDFDIELELKQSGFAPLQIDLPLGDKQAIRLHLGGLSSALMVIDGKEDRDAAPEHSNKDARLKRNVWQRLTAKVRHHGENVSIDVALDGDRVGQFSGLRSRITFPKWVKPDPVHVKFAGTGNSSTLELEFRRALVHIDPPAAMELEKTSPK